MENREVFCDVCQVRLTTRTNANQHFNGKRHRTLSGIATNEDQESDRSVHVRSLPINCSELSLSDYFSRFGSIDKVFKPKDGASRFANVTFSDVQSQRRALECSSHWLGGTQLKVEQKRPRRVTPPTIEPNVSTHSTTIEKLKTILNIKEQLIQLPWIATLDANDLNNRRKFCDSLEKQLKSFYPKCNVRIYGSTANGYGFKGCDMDVTALIAELEEYDSSSVDYPPLSKCPTIHDIVTGKVSKSQLYSLSKEQSVKFLKNFVSKKVLKCRRVMFIPSVRCPIVRFDNNQLGGISCDLSVQKRMGIVNSALLKLYGLLDTRIRPVIVALRYWAKVKDFLGSGHKFSSYAFTWIIIFYMQQLEPPLAPSVDTLQSLADNEETIDGFNTAFCRDLNRIPKTENKTDIVDIFKGFFTFYLSFDFTMFAISPKTGKPANKLSLKSELVTYPDFKLSSITVHDPFELNRNVTASVTNLTLVRFLECLQKTKDICQHPDFHKPPGLVLLLEEIENENPKDKKQLKRVAAEMVDSEESQAKFSIPLTPDFFQELAKQMPSMIDKNSEELAPLILAKACHTVFDIFLTGLLMHCTILTNNVGDAGAIDAKQDGDIQVLERDQREMQPVCQELAKRQKTDVPVDSKLEQCLELMRFNCEAFHRVWQGRRNKTSPNADPLQKERFITELVLKESSQQQSKSNEPLFSFDVALTRQSKGSVHLLGVELLQREDEGDSSRKKNKEFVKSLVPFLHAYVPKTLKMCMTLNNK